MTSIFETLTAKFRQRERKKAEGFNSLAADLAAGKKLDDKFVLDQLELYRRSPAELETAVERITKRQAARAALDRARAVPGERAKINSQLAAAVAQFEGVVTVARQKLETETGPLQTRLLELDQIEKAGRSGEAILQQTAQLPEVTLAEIEKLKKRRAELDHARNQSARHLRGLDDKICQEEGRLRTIATTIMPPTARALMKEEAEEHIAAMKPDAELLAGEVTTIDSEMRKIDSRLAEIEAEKLAP